MKFTTYGEGHFVLEMTRRNLQALLDKLDDPRSWRTLTKTDEGGFIIVRAVEDAEHYADRTPGAVYMPSTGKVR